MPDMARLGIAVNTAEVVTAEERLDALTRAAHATQRASTALSTEVKETSVTLARVGQTAVVVRDNVDDLRAAQVAASAEMQLAATRAKELDGAFRALRPNVQGGSGALAEMNAAGRSFDMRGVALQLSQVGQQTMATGNFVSALAIQLPDMATGFGTVGIMAGVAAGALLPLVANLISGGEEAEEATESVDAFATALTSIERYAEIAKQPLASLRDEFHEFAEDVRADARDMMELSSRQLAGAVGGPSSAGREAIQPGLDALKEYRQALNDIYANAASQGGKMTLGDIMGLQQARADLAAVLEPMGLTLLEVERMDRAFRELGESGDASLDVLLERMTTARDVMEDAYEGVIMPPEVFEDFEKLNSEIDRIRGVISDTADVTRQELVESLGGAWDKAGEFASAVLTAANNVGTLNDAQLSGIWSGFDGLIERARSFLGLTNEIGESVNGGGMSGDFAGVRGTPTGDYQRDLVAAVMQLSERIRVAPEDILALFSYETGRTMDPAEPGPITEWGQHMGLYQAGAPQRADYGYNPHSGNAFEHVASFERYLRGSGFVPGMSREDMYSTVNAGGPGRWSASDVTNGNGGDAANPTVLDKVNAIYASNSGFMNDAKELMALYAGAATGASYQNDAFAALMGAAIDRGEAAQDAANPGAPPTRPMDLGVAEVSAPGRPRARPMDLQADHLYEEAELTDRAREAVEALISVYDEGAGIAQQMADAREAVTEAVKRGTYTEQEGAAILANYEAHLRSNTEAAKEMAEETAEALQTIENQYREFGDGLGQTFADILVNGENWREGLGNLLANTASDILASGVSDAFMEIFSPVNGGQRTGNNWLGTLIGAFTGGGGGGGYSGTRPVARPFAGGGSTGDGPRTGGLDGQGGFLAMLHPQEDVIDRARGQKAAGGDTLIFDLSGTYGDEALFSKVQGMIMQGLMAQDRRMPDRVETIRNDRRKR